MATSACLVVHRRVGMPSHVPFWRKGAENGNKAGLHLESIDHSRHPLSNYLQRVQQLVLIAVCGGAVVGGGHAGDGCGGGPLPAAALRRRTPAPLPPDLRRHHQRHARHQASVGGDDQLRGRPQLHELPHAVHVVRNEADELPPADFVLRQQRIRPGVTGGHVDELVAFQVLETEVLNATTVEDASSRVGQSQEGCAAFQELERKR